MSAPVDFEKELEGIPANRVGNFNDIATLATFLCTKDAEYMTGQTLNSNGGEYFGT